MNVRPEVESNISSHYQKLKKFKEIDNSENINVKIEDETNFINNESSLIEELKCKFNYL